MEEYHELGMTLNEGKVYDTLVKFGKLGAGNISKKSGVSYSKIYDILGGLVNKGLVNLVPEKTKKFIPGDPKVLIKLIEKREKELAKAKVKAAEMKTFYDIREKNPVEMVSGKGNFDRIVKELIRPQKYDYSIKWSMDARREWLREGGGQVKKNVSKKDLVRYDKETEKNVKKWMRVHKDIRHMDNSGVAISIRDDKEVMLGLIKSNVTLLVKDAAFAKVMKQLFLAYYNQAEKIK